MPETGSNSGVHSLRRDMGIWTAVSLVVGTVIGSGIFIVPRTMTAEMGSPFWVLAVWVFGGVLTLAGVLTYAELAAMMPEAGGEYVYLKEAYGPFWGFLYGWTQMWVAKSASVATLATGFFYYLANFVPSLENVVARVPLPIGENGGPLEIRAGQLLAMGVILGLGFVNWLGVRQGAGLQVTVTILKVALFATVIGCGLFLGHAHVANFSTNVAATRRRRGVLRGAGSRSVGLRRLEQRWYGVGRDPQPATQPPIGPHPWNPAGNSDLFGGKCCVLRGAARFGSCLEQSRSGGNDAESFWILGRWGRELRRDDFHLCRSQRIHLDWLAGALRSGARRVFLQSLRACSL